MTAVMIFLSLPILSAEKSSSGPGAGSSASSNSSSPSNTRVFIYGIYAFHSGPSATSLAGQKEIGGAISVEEKTSLIRFFASAECTVIASTPALLGAATSSSVMSSVSLRAHGGLKIFPFSSTKNPFDPFISGSASYSRGGLRVTPPTEEVPYFSRPNLFGYEVSLGLDMKGSSGKLLIRPRLSYAFETGAIGSLKPFTLTKMQASLGIGF